MDSGQRGRLSSQYKSYKWLEESKTGKPKSKQL